MYITCHMLCHCQKPAEHQIIYVLIFFGVQVHLSSSDPTRALLQSHKDRIKSLSLSSDGRLQEDHPLKARVKALMKQSHRNTQLSLSDRGREVCSFVSTSVHLTKVYCMVDTSMQLSQKFLFFCVIPVHVLIEQN